MGACLSCLGLNRHSEQQSGDETDSLLGASQRLGYGSTVMQPDEEEQRRYRETLNRIVEDATANMIDVVNPVVTPQIWAQVGANRHKRTSDLTRSTSEFADNEAIDPEEEERQEQEDLAYVRGLEAELEEYIEMMRTIDVSEQYGPLFMEYNLLEDEVQPSAA